MALIEPFTGSGRFNLFQLDPEFDAGLSKEASGDTVQCLGQELTDLLDLLFYAGKSSLLIVLQGRDTSGKDGTIRHLLSFANAQSCRVAAFKVPSSLELSHDFLWRCHAVAPPRGGTMIFNRSHYEDVLVVRVHDLVPKDVWMKRYEHINNFEQLLVDSGTIVMKFALMIGKDEQEQRLLDREQEVEKAWKLSAGDWKERQYWDQYSEAYEDAINRCASADAPWYVIPANKKWFRNLAITEAIVNRLRLERDGWLDSLEKIGKERMAELAEYRSSLAS